MRTLIAPALLYLFLLLFGTGCKKDKDGPDPTPAWHAIDTVVVTYISPSCVMGGDPFIIRGLNIDGTSRVFIDGIEAAITSRSGNYIAGIVPDSAQTMVDQDVYAVVTNHVAPDTGLMSIVTELPPQPLGPSVWHVPDTLPPVYQPDIAAYWVNANDPDHVFYFDVTADNGDSGYFDVMETHDSNAFLNGNDGVCGQMQCFWQGAYVTFLMHREDENTLVLCQMDTTSFDEPRMICWDLGGCGYQFILKRQ